MKNYLICLVLLLAISIRVIAQTVGSATLVVGRPSSLLAGCTPATIGTGSCPTPSGWTVVATQDFESGSVPSSQTTYFSSPGITSANPHTGTKSVQSFLSFDQAGEGWTLESGIGSFADEYLSFWEFPDANGTINDEMFVAKFGTSDPTGKQCWADVNIDMFGFSANTKTAPILLQNQACVGGQPNEANYGPSISRNWGTWSQWEIWYHPNTFSGGPYPSPGTPNSDGFTKVFRNGQLVFQVLNHNINGTLSMNNNTILAGGVYSKSVWRTPSCSGSCSPMPVIGTGVLCGGYGSFSSNICPPQPPSFNWYIDDIVVLKK